MKYKFNLRKYLLIGTFASAIMLISACDNDEAEDPPNGFVIENPGFFKASIDQVYDSANNTNASDLVTEISRAERHDDISKYVLFIGKPSTIKDLNEETFELPEAANFFNVNDFGEIKLPASLLDVEGNGFVKEEDYQMMIAAYVKDRDSSIIFSEASSTFQFRDEAIVTTVLSSLGANTGPDDVTIGPDGNFYISNYGGWTGTQGNGTQVFKLTQEGTLSVFMDGLDDPLGSVFDSNGNFFVIHGDVAATDYFIAKLDASGNKDLTFATIDHGAAGLAIDDEDNLYVSYGLNKAGKISKVTPEGAVSDFIIDPLLSKCIDIEFHDDVFYISSNDKDFVPGQSNTAKIFTVDMNGTIATLAQWSGAVSNLAKMGDYVYVAGYGTFNVYKVSIETGEQEIIAGSGQGSADGPGSRALFNDPNGMTADVSNNVLYVTEYSSRALRKIILP